VTDGFYAGGTTIGRTGSAYLEVQGTLYASDVIFSGLPVELVSTMSPGSHFLDRVTFTNYAPTDTQLFIRLPGNAAPMTLTSPVFESPPQSGFGYYIDAARTGAVGGPGLTIVLTTPTPTGVAQPLYKIGANTVVTWP
jgi:hypothetical protein